MADEKDYLEWFDWTPGILRAIWEIKKYASIRLKNLPESDKSALEKVRDYLLSMGLVEESPDGDLNLTDAGEKVYVKLQEINEIMKDSIDFEE
ncbi:MAG: hypothetical protein M1327_01465 [Candidatus Thermoplasmatota archaeon]|nr:hypothetical protein [Candidatus Thermoplasmatota archaeon]